MAIPRYGNPHPASRFPVALLAILAAAGLGCQDRGRAPSPAPVVGVTSSALTWTSSETKLAAGDPGAGDWFGYSVGVSGDTLLVGSINDDDRAADSGSAYVHTRAGTAWIQQQKITASDGAKTDAFGWSVALDGNRLAVGAPRVDLPNIYKEVGAVYVYSRAGTTWSQQHKITASDWQPGDHFGHAVSMDGITILVGARYSDAKGADSGKAYVYTWNGSSWNPQWGLTAPDGAADDQLGTAVSMDGDTALVAARYDDDRGTDSGSAYVYTRASYKWSLQQKLTASDGVAGDMFGTSVSVSGDWALVGANLENARGTNAGAAYLFSRAGTTWTETQKLTASDGGNGDQFATSAAMSGGMAVIGAYKDDNKGTDSGPAYLFTRSGTTWAQRWRSAAKDGLPKDYFGLAVALDGARAVVGAYGADVKYADDGAAYVEDFFPVGPNGAACTAGAGCASGFCVDGVCCDSACGGTNPNDCKTCKKALGASADGVCSPVPKGVTCRPAASSCDVDETCDGTPSACPANKLAPQGTVCRVANGLCDEAETCTGSAAGCPADGIKAAGQVCRSSKGLCDPEEKCDGANKACPADKLLAQGAVCRTWNGDCDVREFCDGVTAACPTDGVRAATYVCRASAGDCDVTEKCDGTTKACPADNFMKQGTTCRTANGLCDLADVCSGSSAACPVDAIQMAGQVCRSSKGLCDPEEKCDGTNKACPADKLLAAGDVCRTWNGPCDVREFCSGTTPACPADGVRAATYICRASAGDCDLPEKCNGSAKSCPPDVYLPNGTPCTGGACSGGKCLAKPDAGTPADLGLDGALDSGQDGAAPDSAAPDSASPDSSVPDSASSDMTAVDSASKDARADIPLPDSEIHDSAVPDTAPDSAAPDRGEDQQVKREASATQDAAPDPGAPETDEGCSCRTASGSPPLLPLFMMVLLVLLRRSVRRQQGTIRSLSDGERPQLRDTK